MKNRVSNIITSDNVKSWEPPNVITITAPTGAGKSYFIKNYLYKIAKANNQKILMLIHRVNCVNQFEQEIIRDNKKDVIDIKTYQHLESNKEFSFKDYMYIVLDEFHYFLSDAAFNKTTDISLNMILEQKQSILICMSATGNYVKRYLNGIKKINTIDYEMPINYKFIDNLTFFYKNDTLSEFIKEAIEKKQKGIFFIQSAKKAYELYCNFKDNCIFNCSKTNKNYFKYVDQDKINNMLINEKFDELILITTTCLDTGVNIIDPDVKHIVCDVEDIGTLIQCIGRNGYNQMKIK